MELQQLRYFAAVARLGNFTRAAEACHVSQPTLSQQIGKLELDLGQSLLDRGGRLATLTDAGRVLFERVEHALGVLDEARQSLQTVGVKRRLIIAAIPTIAPYLLPKVLTEFLKEHHTANVEVKEYTTEECLKALTNGGLDCAILALPVTAEHLATETLFADELLLALPRKHPLSRKSPLRLQDVATEPFVLLHEAHCLSGQALAFCARKSLSPLVTAQLHQLSTVLELIRLGHGISLVPAMCVPAHARSGCMFRRLSGDKPSRTIAVAWSKLRFRHPLFDEFVKVLKAMA